ncbi:protein SMALL AUXIN UP-REGULATED RNA 12-like [Diospyros lotus]|uniref:protein SMALL AUXIN UP-REGULATED RNA 12-like n=1 Tax=Diospyros lotus TaxID=55363 RepID=UPI00225AA7EE|nr:protein SMALL AUXIN UP-REGULATED RNA 12-like [Diospyros lotus]
MALAMKKVNMIRQIVRLKQVVQRWKYVSLKRCLPDPCSDGDDGFDSDSGRTPPGCLAVYAGGPERRRFVIPTRFLNLPVFVSLLRLAEEEFGYQNNGGLVLPCEVGFFETVLDFLERDEEKYGGLGLDDFIRLFSDPMASHSYSKASAGVSGHRGFTPVARVLGSGSCRYTMS